jgi:hypothetical protein
VESREAIKSSLKVQLDKYSRMVPVLSGIIFVLCFSVLLILRLFSSEADFDVTTVVADTLTVASIIAFISFFILRLLVESVQRAHVKSFAKKRELRLQRREEELAMRYRKLQTIDQSSLKNKAAIIYGN